MDAEVWDLNDDKNGIALFLIKDGKDCGKEIWVTRSGIRFILTCLLEQRGGVEVRDPG